MNVTDNQKGCILHGPKVGNALGAIASVMADHERRIAAMERRLSHKGGAE